MFGHEQKGYQQFGLIQCKVCNKIYDDPRLLHCLHSFCGRCLDEHITKTTRPSDDMLLCPLCEEATPLPHTYTDLTRNVMLERLVSQTRKDKTTLVAGREVEKISREALSEADLSCPDVRSAIQDIANTAGRIIADNVNSGKQPTDVATVKMKNGLNLKTGQLQVRAMDIVESIDKVNCAVDMWADMRRTVRDNIKQRSLTLQDAIRRVERRLLSRLDDKDAETAVRDEAFVVKNKLHKVLKSSLSMVDFLRILNEFGDKQDIDVYSDMIRRREGALYSGPVVFKKTSYSFDAPTVSVDEGLELMFGQLSEVTVEENAWDPSVVASKMDPTRAQPSLTSGVSVDEYIESQHLIERHRTDDGVETEGDRDEESVDNGYHSRLSFRQHTRPRPRGSSALREKSVSFDAGISVSPYDYVTSKNQGLYDIAINQNSKNNQTKRSEESSRTDSDTTQFQILNEQEDKRHLTGNTSHNIHSQQGQTDPSFQAAIDSLVNSSRIVYPMGQMSRRVSAPPSMVIDSLNRRRLNALSILQRANISVDGMNMSTDIESGMSAAREEWQKENTQRREQTKDVINENV